MPSSLDTPVLQVDANVIHKVDTTNPQNLFSMWTVFARCADSVAQGRRLENLSWRLWTRETFCCEGGDRLPSPASTSTVALPRRIHTPHRASTSDEVPQLSGSVDSVADEEAVEFTSEFAAVDILRPRIRRQDSCASSRSRGRERHITSDDLEKMVVSIVQQKGPLEVSHSAPLPRKPLVAEAPLLDRSDSTTTESSPDKSSETHSDSPSPASSPDSPSASSRTTVVRGFSPSSQVATTSRVSKPKPSPPRIPAPEETPAPMPVLPKKQQAKFALGESSSCDGSFSDQRHSPEMAKLAVLPLKRKMFQFGGSSEEDSSLKSALHSSRANPLLNAQKKQTSFNNQIVTRTIPTVAISDDQSETDYVDESAIDDDDDSSDWEDSIEDGGKSSAEDKTLFQRVDSKANLTSRRSLITLMLAQNNRSQRLGNNTSQSTSALPRTRISPNGPSLVASPNDSDDGPLMMKAPRSTLRPINEMPRSSAQPIMTSTNHLLPPAALSPRTTRRNMLATEMTESLRRHLLWERSQKTQTANAVLKRRHTSQDVANLKQYPEKPYMNRKADDVNASSWDQFLAKETHNGYHSKGW